MVVTADIKTAVSGAGVVRKRNKLRDQEKNLLLRKLRKDTIKTLKTDSNNGVSQTTQTIRRPFETTTRNSGVISITAGTNETFAAKSNTDYIVVIITAGSGGSGAADEDATHMGVSFAINDDVTVSYGVQEVDITGKGEDERNSGFGISYTMGSMSVAAYAGKTENGNGVSSADDEGKGLTLSIAF